MIDKAQISGDRYSFASRFTRVGIAALAGGIAAKLSGGNFADGARMGAFSRWFNEELENQNSLSDKERHWRRNELNNNDENVPPNLNAARLHDSGFRELTPKQSLYHRMGNGAENNVKFVSNDGHYEAVYNSKTGALVTDIVNKGTYNYAAPENWLDHFNQDVWPYWLW